MLGYNLYGEMVFVDINARIASDSFYKALLDFIAGVVGMVENTEFRMPPFTVKVECAIILFVEIHPPLNQLTNLPRSLCHHLPDSFRVGEVVTRHHGVVDMFVEVIDFKVCDRCHPALRQCRIRFIKGCFANQRHTAFFCHFQRETHSGYSGTYYKKIIFLCHGCR